MSITFARARGRVQPGRFCFWHFPPGDKIENCSAQFLAVCWIVHVEFKLHRLRHGFSMGGPRRGIETQRAVRIEVRRPLAQVVDRVGPHREGRPSRDGPRLSRSWLRLRGEHVHALRVEVEDIATIRLTHRAAAVRGSGRTRRLPIRRKSPPAPRSPSLPRQGETAGRCHNRASHRSPW